MSFGMFDQESIRASMVAEMRRMADQMNKVATATYLGACQNWAANYGRGDKPVVPKAIEAVVSWDPSIVVQFLATESPVSTARPEDFLPMNPHLRKAVGGPVGGPIPETTNRYYLVDGFYPSANDRVEVDNRVFQFVRPYHFGGHWEEITRK